MRRATALLGVLVVVCVALLAVQAGDPVLWTAVNASATLSDEDLSIASKMSADKAESVLPLMQDLLSQSGTVVLSVKVKDWESAQRDLERYAEMTSSMNNLVVSLDLSETDIEDFRRNSEENVDALQTLVNGTQRFAEIQELRIEYRDSDDPSKLYSIIYEGEALKDELAQAYTSYAGREASMVAAGQKYEADTAEYEESVDGYEEIVEEIADLQEESSSGSAAPTLPPPGITIFISPDAGRFGDEIMIRGTLATHEGGAEVVAFIDSRRYANTTTTDDGRYTFTYRIGRVRAGTHLAYVQSGRSVSDLALFTVNTAPSEVTLRAVQNATAGTVECSGRLTALGQGVGGAEVALIADGALVGRVQTGADGRYQGDTVLEPGEHTLKAVFAAEGFPLEPCESEEVPFTIREPLFTLQTLLATAAAVSVGLLGGLAYLRWGRRRRRGSAQAAEEEEAPAPVVEAVAPEEEEAVLEVEPPEPEGPLTPLDEAAHLWERLALAAGRRYLIPNPRAKTPREIAATLRGTPVEEEARAFVRLYEGVRYAGIPCGEDEVGELRQLYEAVAGG
ncbi:DUF4129 domain-containing protein [Methanofollis fontis]|uniref:Protein-glutamine gamma-glutamyltransferase-like C-terminal domain-containing protein n=1 Tax=Methanofollis fontis TaxID=2052832 RepID=A0A483CX58_9EURY|nr:DUF4129 domain-containing protein [Methanofollis fontis]TAJ43682.1 hypothetical protein CUJ86_10110 [Methanofollis fontis]